MNLAKMVSIILDATRATTEETKRAIHSIDKQTYPHIERILITKNTNEDDFDCKQDFCKIQTTGNLMNDILLGFEQSKGECVVLLDARAYISQDFVRKMLSASLSNDADVCVTDWVYESENGRKIIPYEELRNNDFCFDNSEIMQKYISGHGCNFSWELLCNKLIKRDVLEKAKKDLLALSKVNKGSLMAVSFVIFKHCSKLVNCHNVPVFISDVKVGSNYEFLSERNYGNLQILFGKLSAMLSDLTDAVQLKKEFHIWKNKILSNMKSSFKSNQEIKDFVKFFPNIGMAKCVNLPLDFVDFGYEYSIYEMIIDNILSEETKVVSFDVFDTLIKRECLYPIDVFDVLSVIFKDKTSKAFILDFKNLRVSAENALRQLDSSEITLQEIYDYMVKEYGFDATLAGEIMQKELELELDFCVQRKTGKDLYDIAEINGKQIIYTSDMYLDKSVILKILEKNGYSASNQLFLSSEHKVFKASGELFKVVFKELKIKSAQMVHIGDNYVADVEMPSKLGVRAFHLANVRDLFYERNYNAMFYGNKSTMDEVAINIYLGLRFMCGMVASELYDFPYTHNVSDYNCSTKLIGYYLIGMHLYSFVDWIKNNSSKSDMLHFVARDGYLPMKAFEMFAKYEKNLPKINYLYLSRRLLFPLGFFNTQDLFSSMGQIIFENFSINKFLGYFPDKCINKDFVDKLNHQARAQKFKNQDDFMRHVPTLTQCINYDKLSVYRKKVKENVFKELHPGDTIIDVGYSGRDESILYGVMGFGLNSLYLHTRVDLAYMNFQKAKTNNKCYYNYFPKVTFDMREIMFSSLSASVIGYDDENNKLIYDHNAETNEAVVMVISTIQNNALKFVEDFLKKYAKYDDAIIYPKDAASLPWETYLLYSSRFDKKMFESFIFEDDIGIGTHSLIDYWELMCHRPEKVETKHKLSFKRRVANKLFPYGTRRRKFAKKVYLFLKKVKNKVFRRKKAK